MVIAAVASLCSRLGTCSCCCGIARPAASFAGFWSFGVITIMDMVCLHTCDWLSGLCYFEVLAAQQM